jgi:hypothetical protein
LQEALVIVEEPARKAGAYHGPAIRGEDLREGKLARQGPQPSVARRARVPSLGNRHERRGDPWLRLASCRRPGSKGQSSGHKREDCALCDAQPGDCGLGWPHAEDLAEERPRTLGRAEGHEKKSFVWGFI